MTALAATCLGLAVALSRRTRPGRLRLPATARRGDRRLAAMPLVGVAVVVSAGGLVVLGRIGVVAVVAAGLLVLRHRLRRPPAVDHGQIALCLDLLGGTLAAGAGSAAALEAVASAVPAPVGSAFATAAAALARGEDPARTWTALGDVVPALSDAARVCARAAVSGAAVADELHRLSAALRARTQVERRRRLQRATVWLVLPLGLCFLPAFVLVGVVPLVVAAVPGLLR